MPDAQKPAEEEGKPYRFDCVMSYLHRYIPADGTWVGLNGFNKIVLNFYNDSPPLPSQMITQTVGDTRKFVSTAPDIKFSTDAGTIRRYEVSIVLSLAAAKSLQETLVNFIKLAEPNEEKK